MSESEMEPPQFQEASRCDVCKCSFSTFRRRHHCRCCGRSLCAEHSSNQMALPQFGLHSSVRVCADCFNNASGYTKDSPATASNGISAVTKQASKLDISMDSDPKMEQPSEKFPVSGVSDCKCGMPLCICEVPAPPREAAPVQVKTTSTITVNPNPKPKKADITPRSRGSTSQSKPGTVFNLGQVTNSNIERPLMDYEVSGEGLREAIKNGDTAGARKLLSQGVDANYYDKQGSSLLHLAAVFNQTEIVFALMDSGAKLDCKNSQGETPLDCAPAMLQYKMRSKMEESQKLDPQHGH